MAENPVHFGADLEVSLTSISNVCDLHFLLLVNVNICLANLFAIA